MTALEILKQLRNQTGEISKLTNNNQKTVEEGSKGYVLDEQIGFILRQVSQRHSNIFSKRMTEVRTTTQFAALAKLQEVGICSQNKLGRLTAMDATTIKGVVERLGKRELIEIEPDVTDGRRLLVKLSRKGKAVIKKAIPLAQDITEETLRALSPANQKTLLKLLSRMR